MARRKYLFTDRMTAETAYRREEERARLLGWALLSTPLASETIPDDHAGEYVLTLHRTPRGWDRFVVVVFRCEGQRDSVHDVRTLCDLRDSITGHARAGAGEWLWGVADTLNRWFHGWRAVA